MAQVYTKGLKILRYPQLLSLKNKSQLLTPKINRFQNKCATRSMSSITIGGNSISVSIHENKFI